MSSLLVLLSGCGLQMPVDVTDGDQACPASDDESTVPLDTPEDHGSATVVGDAIPSGDDNGDEPKEEQGAYPAPRPAFCTVDGVDRCAEALAAWEDFMFDYDTQGYCTEDGSSMGWYQGYILNAIVYGYLATRDTAYLEKFVSQANGTLCREDDDPTNECATCLFTLESYDEDLADEWGWYEWDGIFANDGSTRFDFMVSEGITMKALATFVEAVQNDPALDDIYGADADAYLKIMVEDLVPKWDHRDLFEVIDDTAGVYVWWKDPASYVPGMTLAFNQMYEFSVALLILGRITGDPWYHERAGATFQHFANTTYEEDGLINWNYYTPAGEWDYDENGDARHWVGEEHKCTYKRMTARSVAEAARHCVTFDVDEIPAIMERVKVYPCTPVPIFGFFDEAKLEEAFVDVSKDPTSWINLVETPELMWVMDARERYRTVCDD